jgi:long-subunit fatty acid transport protein
MKKHVFAAIVISIMCVSIAAAEDGLMAVGIGARSTSMGGLAIAFPGDAFVIAENPAGLATIPQLRVDLDFGVRIASEFSLDSQTNVGESTDNGISFNENGYPLYPNIAGAYSFRDIGIVAGIGMIRVAEQYNDFETEADATDMKDLRSYFTTLRFMAGAAYSFPSRLSVGGALYVDYMETNFRTYLNKKFAQNRRQKIEYHYPGENVFIRMPGARGFGSFGLIAGLLWQPFTGLDLGAMFDLPVNQISLHGNGDTYIYMEEINEFNSDTMGNSLYDQQFQMDMKMPVRLGLGATFAPIDLLRIGLEGKYFMWSQTMDSIEVTIDSKKDSIDLGWNNQIVFAGGLEFVPWRSLALRFGGNYGTGLVDDASYTHLYDPLPKVHITGGLGYIFQWTDDISTPVAISGLYGYTLKTHTGDSTHDISPVFADAEMSSEYSKINMTISLLHF